MSLTTKYTRIGLFCALVLSSVLRLPGQATAGAPGTDAADTPDWTFPAEFLAEATGNGPLGWPQARAEARPGAYWWWPGNAVNREDLTWNLEIYQRAGWGNLGIVSIYGVKGEEERFIDLFSPEWFEMYNHTVDEARRLDMNIDLTPGAGWRFGGPHVTSEHAEQNYDVRDGRIVVRQSGAKVKRAGPGGKGLSINPYSKSAVAFHFDWVARHFEANQGQPPNLFYYDSFENRGDWSPELSQSFEAWRGYRLEDHAEAFAGAARYTTHVELPAHKADTWVLDLGDVRESARVWINGKPAGLAFAQPFQVELGDLLKPGRNEICIEVTNLSANRIRDLDQRGVPWKKFKDLNIVSHRYKAFDASGWPLKPSGLLGPVTLRAYITKG